MKVYKTLYWRHTQATPFIDTFKTYEEAEEFLTNIGKTGSWMPNPLDARSTVKGARARLQAMAHNIFAEDDWDLVSDDVRNVIGYIVADVEEATKMSNYLMECTTCGGEDETFCIECNEWTKEATR